MMMIMIYTEQQQQQHVPRVSVVMKNTASAVGPYLQAYVVCNYSPSGNVRGANYNVFEPSKKLANACRPGTRKGKSGLCEIRNEIEYRKHLGLITVPPPKTHS